MVAPIANNNIPAMMTAQTSASKQNATAYAKAANAAERFAGIFVDQLLERMMPNLFGSAVGSSTYQGMILKSLSAQLTKTTGGMGLVPILDKALGIPDSIANKINEIPTTILAPSQSITDAMPTSLSSSAQEFINQLLPLARSIGKALGVNPKFILSQAALETGWGKYVIGNNLFGIKALPGEPAVQSATVEVIHGIDEPTIANFRDFSSISACMEHYAQLIKEHYPQVLNAGSNIQEFTQGLVQGGYATDPNYAAKIQQIAELPIWSSDG